jgi:hypothetical protein
MFTSLPLSACGRTSSSFDVGAQRGRPPEALTSVSFYAHLHQCITSAKLYGRKRELGLLRRLSELFFAVVYGGRCVGETALVLKLKKRHHLYFFMNPRKPPPPAGGMRRGVEEGGIKFVPPGGGSWNRCGLSNKRKDR